MGKILVSASYFDTLCSNAWKLLETNGHEVIYDSHRKFPAYSYEELVGRTASTLAQTQSEIESAENRSFIYVADVSKEK